METAVVIEGGGMPCTETEGIRAICVACGVLIISNNGNGDKTISSGHFTLNSGKRNQLGRIFCKKCRTN